MGVLWCKMKAKWFGPPPKQFRMLLLGLDSAGKTTILHQLKSGEKKPTVPTIGFNVETIALDNMQICVWDVGGQDKLRSLWRSYYAGTSGVVFVIDSADINRLDSVKDELHHLMHEVELKYSIVAIVANKQDLPNALSGDKLIDELELTKLRCKYKVFECIATKNIGITELLHWLSENMEEI
eukprot:445141_1